MSARGLVWTLWAVTVALVPPAVVLGVLATDATLPTEREDFLPLIIAMIALSAVYASVGAVVAGRLPRNPIGWIFLAIGLALALVGAAYGYADHAIYGGADLPLARQAAWLANWLFILPVFIGPCAALFLFPTGRPPSKRWRPAAWFVVGLAPFVASWSAVEPGEMQSFPGVENPYGLSGGAGSVVEAMNAAGEAVFAPLLFLIALASIVVRYRRGGAHERLQIKWVAYAAAVMVVCFVASFVVGEVVPTWASDTLFVLGFAAFGAIPVAAGIAILRHRLYEIDLVINRTLVYGALTAVLASAYVGLVLLLGLVLSPLTSGSDLAIALSTLAVATLFVPVRSRVQALVDRRFYRRKYDAARTLERFGARLRSQTDLEALRAELTGAVAETMQPAHVSLWLRGERP
jgi:hypothetical protein